MNKKIATIAAAVVLVSTSSAFAADSANDQCEQGAVFKSGLRAFTNGEYATAAQTFDSLAQAGDPCGQYWLGKMYNLGQGVSKDHAKYVELVKKSGAQGYSKARAELYVMGQ
jgi:uncharacterized protein